MKAVDIEKIANQVMGKLGSPVQASAGCAGISDPETFSCGIDRILTADYSCQSDYTCGGAGVFECDIFQCLETFGCCTNYSQPV